VRPRAPLQFAVFRILLGASLAAQLVSWWPHAEELLSDRGFPALGRGGLAGVFPSPLTAWSEPWEVRIFLAVVGVVCVAFTLGWARRACAVALWYGWTCAGHASPLLLTVASPFVGWLLLATVLVPPGEPLRPFARPRPGGGRVPKAVLVAGWVVLAAGYGLSGMDKLASAGWRSGDALRLAVELPYARETGARIVSALGRTPDRLLTWTGLAVELAFPVLAIARVTRPVAWASGAALQLGLLALFAFPGLTAGMLLMHVFLFDPGWLDRGWIPAQLRTRVVTRLQT
jgi:hypothetical protein